MKNRLFRRAEKKLSILKDSVMQAEPKRFRCCSTKIRVGGTLTMSMTGEDIKLLAANPLPMEPQIVKEEGQPDRIEMVPMYEIVWLERVPFELPQEQPPAADPQSDPSAPAKE